MGNRGHNAGGKDSDNILDLTKRSGVLFEAHYSYIVLDPPELLRQARLNPYQPRFEGPIVGFGRKAKKCGKKKGGGR
jgi:hypothetical protein